MAGLLSLLITLIILGLIFYVVIWAIGYIGLPEPFNKIVKVVLAVVIVVYLLGVLMGAMPYPMHFWR